MASAEQHSSTTPSTFDPDAPYALCGRPALRGQRGAFSLLEVLFAMTVFFVVVFAILSMVVQCVGAARALQQQHADPGMVASMFALSNVLEEQTYEGDFEGIVEGYTWLADVYEVGSNGLFRIDIAVQKTSGRSKSAGETLSVLKFTGQPSKRGAGGGARLR